MGSVVKGAVNHGHVIGITVCHVDGVGGFIHRQRKRFQAQLPAIGRTEASEVVCGAVNDTDLAAAAAGDVDFVRLGVDGYIRGTIESRCVHGRDLVAAAVNHAGPGFGRNVNLVGDWIHGQRNGAISSHVANGAGRVGGRIHHSHGVVVGNV